MVAHLRHWLLRHWLPVWEMTNLAHLRESGQSVQFVGRLSFVLGLLILVSGCGGRPVVPEHARVLATPDAEQAATLTSWPTPAPVLTAQPVATGTPRTLWTVEPSAVTETPSPPGSPGTDQAGQGTPTPPFPASAPPATTRAAGAPFGSLAPAIRLRIPSLDLDVPVQEVSWDVTYLDGAWRSTWQTADGAAGHHRNSANPGEAGNVVISGHHNSRGEVFRDVSEIGLPGARLGIGDRAVLVAADRVEHTYRIVKWDRFVAGADPELEAHYLAQTTEPILTLVTCWPREDNTHRVVVILALEP